MDGASAALLLSLTLVGYFVSRSEDRAVPAFEALSAEQFDASWKRDLDVKDRPAGEVLAELVKKFGMKLDSAPAHETALAKPISLQLKGGSRWQLAEAVARQAGLYPVYETVFTGGFGKPGGSQTHVKLKQLPRLRPVDFAGPFLVEIESLQEFAPHGVGIIRPKVQALDLPEAVLKSLDGAIEPFTVEEIVDNQGRNLRDTGQREMMSGINAVSRYDQSYDVALKNLVKDATTIKTFRGKIRVALPTKVEEVRFEPLADNTTKKAGSVEVALKSVKELTMYFNKKPIKGWSLSFEIKGAPHNRLKFAAYNAKEELIEFFLGESTSFPGQDAKVEKIIQGQTPAAVVVNVITETKIVEYDFRFENLPLTADPRKPEAIVPATFAGHDTPFSLEFVQITDSGSFAQAQFRIVNHSDQPIREFDMKLDYLGPGGKLDDWPRTSHGPTPTLPLKELPLVVGKQSTAVIETYAPFMPAGTTKIVATPLKAIFANATTWEAMPKGK